MVLHPANFFQLFDDQQADFQLGANGSKLSATERDLWHNIEVYARVIKEAGLQDKLREAHRQALENFAATENGRHARYAPRTPPRFRVPTSEDL